MTLNISAVSAPRNRKGTVLQSESNIIEDVIEKIECLRLARDHGTRNTVSDKAERKEIDECERKLSKCKISNRRTLNDNEEHDEDEDKEEDLIERGPSKSHFSTRRKPYWQNVERTSTFVNESVRQIMQDKTCREIINPCLDKLQDTILERISWDYENNQNESQIYGLKKDVYENDSTDDVLLNEIMNGAFQPAQQVTENLVDSCAVVSRSESSGSSISSLSPVKLNFYQNSVNSPEVSSTSSPYTPQSSFSSCSPSSSRESCDAYSPNGSYRTSVNSRIPETENNSVYNISDKMDNLLKEIYGCDFTPTVNELFDNLEKTKSEIEQSQDSPKYSISQQSLTNSNDKSTNEFLKSDNSEITETLFWTDAIYSPQKMKIEIKNPPELTDYTALLGYPNSRLSNEQVDQSTESTIDFSQILRSSNESLAISNSTFDEHETRNLKHTKNDFKIPKSVVSFQFTPNKLDRKIQPWPSLNLPTIKASERLKEALDPKEVQKAMINLLKKSTEELAHQDKDGDTMLMCLVGNPDELSKKMAYLIPLVERLSTITGALAMTNDSEQDALYLAALNCPQFSFVAGYLAATMLQKEIDISQRLYHRRGDTLIHSIARRGDTHKEILAEILMLKTVRGNEVFDLSRRNYDGRTALHVAIASHNQLTKGVTSVAIVRLLLKYGADPRSKETKCGDNALHLAISNGCDPVIVKLLLQTRVSELVNSTNYNLDTPLHIAAAISNNVPLERQIQVCSLLIEAGAQTNLTNHQGKTPLALASSQRKEFLRNICAGCRS